MRKLQYVLSLLFILLFFSSTTHATEKLKVHIVLDNTDAAQVHLMPVGQREKAFKAAFWTGFFTGGLGGLIAGGYVNEQLKEENDKLSDFLARHFPSNQVRAELFENTLASSLESVYGSVQLVFHPLVLNKKNELDLANVAYKDLDYLLHIKENSGLATPKEEANWGKLGGFTFLQLTGYAVKSKSILLQENMEAIGPASADTDGMINSQSRFLESYTEALRAISNSFYWRLSGKNYLHAVASKTAMANEFPAIQKFMEDQADKFKFKQKRYKGWRRPDTNNDYMFITEPKKHNKYVGVVTEIDLLSKELGQDFDTLDEYIAMYMSRLKNMGWNTNTMETHEYFAFSEEWVTFTLNGPNGGIQVFAVSKQGEHIILHRAIILDDIDNYINKFAKTIEGYVHKSELIIKD